MVARMHIRVRMIEYASPNSALLALARAGSFFSSIKAMPLLVNQLNKNSFHLELTVAIISQPNGYMKEASSLFNGQVYPR